jgi:hypothetical protein
MSQIEALYERIFINEEKLSVQLETKLQFNSLRVQLCKRHKTMVNMDATNQSLCARFDSETGVATFWVGERTQRTGFSFTVVENAT